MLSRVSTNRSTRHGGELRYGANNSDPVRVRQLKQLARTKGPVERRLLRMRQTRRGLFQGAAAGRGRRDSWEAKGGDEADTFEDGDESLALIQW